MLNILFTQEDHAAPSSGILHLQGSATLEFCTDLRMALLDALEKAENLMVDVSQVTELDVAVLQLFCAARRSAIRRQRNMVLADNCSAVFFSAVQDAGFNRTHTANCWLEAGQACLWGNCGEPTGREVAS